MSFYDIYDGHKVIWKYGNMGIKLTVLIPLLQKNTRFSIFTDLGIKKTILDIFKISSFVLPFKKWGSFEGPLRLVVQQKKLHIWKWHDKGLQMSYLRSWCDHKWKFWNNLVAPPTCQNFYFLSYQLHKYLIWCPLSCHFQICNFFCCTTSLRGPSNDPHFLKGGYLENI